jgi:radical SAM superfamily enzyme YgiQ (UPF0313 family)
LSIKLYNQASPELKKFWNIDCINSFFVSEIAEKIFTNFEEEIDEFIDDILATETRVIGFSVNITSIYLASRMAKIIKARDPRRLIIFGGPGTYFKHPRELIQPASADIYVIGEGEGALLNILKAYYSSKKIDKSDGILLGKDLGRYQPLPAPVIENLDNLPFPTFSGFDLKEYNQSEDYKPLPLLLSRGCIRRCSYCIDCIMWPKYRFRSPGHIMKEIDYHVVRNHAKAFEFIDLICNGNLAQLSQLCDLIIASGLKFDWVSYAVIRKDMDFELLSKMKKAGCHTLIYGVENGSDRILQRMGKNYTAAEASQVIRDTHEAGICTNINTIVGFPGETEEDFQQTVEFIQKNKDTIDEITNISSFTLFPEAEVGRNKEKFGVHWQEGTDPMLFYDANGLDRQARNQRVARLVEIVNGLNLTKSIVNRPILNPEVKATLKHEKIT